MLVLGVDPGTALCGYGLVRAEKDDLSLVAYGAVSTPANSPLAPRLLQIYTGLSALIAEHHPEAAAVEKLFFAKNARTALAVGHARGVALLAAAQANLPVFEYTPNEVKQAIVGYGGADKHQMQQMVRVLLRLDFVPEPDDAADAIAIAICHLQSSHLQALIKAQE
jgi:crossover junction endodeoxyribonuclease RuvC